MRRYSAQMLVVIAIAACDADRRAPAPTIALAIDDFGHRSVSLSNSSRSEVGARGDWLTFDLREAPVYVSSADGAVRDAPGIPVEPDRTLLVSIDAQLDGGDVELWLIEVGERSVVEKHKRPLRDGFAELTVTPGAHTRGVIVALRLAGTGALRIERFALSTLISARSRWSFSTDAPKRHYVRLSNGSSATARFRLWLNGKGFPTIASIADTIRAMEPEFAGEPLHRKVWRFVRDHRYHHRPLLWKPWLSKPQVLFNSAGFGWCGNAATASEDLWRQLGFRTRNWQLNGHVVSEVFADGRWQLYDADLEVYYEDDSGSVVGVEDLAANPDLVTTPRARLEVDTGAYSTKVSAIYASRNNNHASEPGDKPVADDLTLEFVVPPLSTLDLPYPFEAELRTAPRNEHLAVPRFTNARLRIDQEFRGTIDIPLIIHAMHGRGEVRLGRQTFALGSPELETRLAERAQFDHRVDVVRLDGPLEITYALNPLVYALERDNRVEIEGLTAAEITAELRRAGD